MCGLQNVNDPSEYVSPTQSPHTVSVDAVPASTDRNKGKTHIIHYGHMLMVMVIFNTTDEWRLRQRMVFNQEQAFILYNDAHQGRQEGLT